MYNSRQSAAKLLKEYISKGEGSTTISRKESTVLEELETAGIEFYRLSDTTRKYKCVYGILNVVTNKLYVGSCIDLHARIIRHSYYLRNNKHHSSKLQRSYNKYGENNFIVVIISICNDALKREPMYIKYYDSFNNGYNCTESCYSSMQPKLTAEQIKKRTSKAFKPLMCFDITGNYIKDFKSVTEAAGEFRTSTSNISRCCNGEFRHVKNHVFIYKKDYIPDKSYKALQRDYTFTEEHKSRIALALKGKKKNSRVATDILLARCSKPVSKYSITGNMLEHYSTMKQCCIENKVFIKTLRKHIDAQTPLEGFLYKFN